MQIRKDGKGQTLYNEAKKLIPGGTQLLSKRPEMFLPELWPAYYDSAKGCTVTDLDGNEYYDTCFMGIGANVLGYCDPDVDDAVIQAIRKGSMSTLNAPEEVELANLLVELHPWSDMVRYTKTGGESLAVAVRIARAFTGKDVVLACGYHGWHDWYLAANLEKGDPLSYVHLSGLEPKGVPNNLADTVFIFDYNNTERFHELVERYQGQIAAVVMEPVRNIMPNEGFLEDIRNVTSNEHIVLIFDEVSSGFRICCGGAHLKMGVEPDIITLGKAMSNGYPMGAILGKGSVMEAAQSTFISSTYWTERVGLAAAIASIKKFKRLQVHDRLCEIGDKVSEFMVKTSEKYGINLEITGIKPLLHYEFKYPEPLLYKTFFTQEMLKRGFLASTAFYASYSHLDSVLEGYFEAVEEVFDEISALDGVVPHLDESICHSGFQRLT